jgi:hypothetical protein
MTTATRYPYFADYTDTRLSGILAMARERAAVQPGDSPEYATARNVERMVLAEQAHRARRGRLTHG